MEAVLKQPELLAEIGAPAIPAPAAATEAGGAKPVADTAADAEWQFVPPPDVQLVDACPPKVTCRKGGEYFSSEWLAAAGDAGPLADTVALVQSAPVYAGGRWTAYCRTEPGAVRALLKLPGPLGIPSATDAVTSTLSSSAPGALQPASAPVLQAATGSTKTSKPPREADVLRAVAWSLRSPTPVDLGPCVSLANTVRQASRTDSGVANLGVTADLGAALDLNVGSVAGTLPGAGPVPAAAESAAPAPVEGEAPATEPPSSDFRFALAQAIVYHDNCPGEYIMGSVLTSTGAPMPGVRITLVDEWGNAAEAWSKSGPGDTGQYDFPISTTPNVYTLTVVDASGTPLSAPVTIEHRQGYGGNHSCHTVTWQAY